MLSKTAAAKAARRAVACGFFRPTSTSAWVFCPKCRARVEVDTSVLGPTPENSLKLMLTRHLTDDCEAST